jgi:hypothetical protein
MSEGPINVESLSIRLPEGTRARIDAVLRPGEKPAEAMRAFVLDGITQREKPKEPSP